MVNALHKTEEDVKPVAGWACLAIAIGFVAVITAGLAFVLMAAG